VVTAKVVTNEQSTRLFSSTAVKSDQATERLSAQKMIIESRASRGLYYAHLKRNIGPKSSGSVSTDRTAKGRAGSGCGKGSLLPTTGFWWYDPMKFLQV
jgi:hypothetical protein